MIDPSLLTTIGVGFSGIISVALVYARNNGAFKLQQAKNKVVSEDLFRDELAKRDKDIEKLQTQIQELMSKYSDQRQRDLQEIESWKYKYEEQVEINAKLQSDFATLKATVTSTAMQATKLINNKVEEIQNI